MYQNSGRVGGLVSPRKFKDQDFNLLRDQCLSQDLLFEDDTFPPYPSSIGPRLLKEVQPHQLTWKRPTDILGNPSLIVDGVSRFDITQGDIGDCWVLAALGSLTLQPRFLKNMIPEGQGFGYNYAGIFHFRLWYFGDWVDVVIDDRLPYLNGKLFGVHPRSQNEFWPSLLEKAYAKLRGSYDELHWGYISEAFVNFTGGIQKRFVLQKPPDNLFEIMKAAANSNCLMACDTPGGESGKNRKLQNGIVQGHAYTVTSATEIPYKRGTAQLIRIWNPWGQGEWVEDWSDRMSYEDFKVNFSSLYICNDLPTFLDFGDRSNTIWLERFSQWTGALSRNPQYSIQVVESDLKHDNVVVSLMQKPGNNMNKTPLPAIGFQIVGDGTTHRYPGTQTRDITDYFRLSPGSYTIIPETSQEDHESKYIIRIFQKSQKNIRQPNATLTSVKPKDIPQWNQANFYESIFLRYANQSPYLDASQLQRILNEVVLKDLDIDNRLLQLIAVRYGDSLSRFYFPDFVCCMIRLETMIKAFRKMSDGTRISFNENEEPLLFSGNVEPGKTPESRGDMIPQGFLITTIAAKVVASKCLGEEEEEGLRESNMTG
ncbi:hypothetical protein lerEdw1_018875 [Lerista edwardsae]|nr:hypothetical protein lerEdw1_018875 [Lerista edwardsae]